MKKAIERESRVRHLDGVREGVVAETGLESGGLPAAKVSWDVGGAEVLPLGYLERIPTPVSLGGLGR